MKLYLKMYRRSKGIFVGSANQVRFTAQVQGQYLGRLNRAVKKPDGFYSWIIVMGGTNDLGWGRKPEEIYEDLSKKPAIRLPLSMKVPSSQLFSNSERLSPTRVTMLPC